MKDKAIDKYLTNLEVEFSDELNSVLHFDLSEYPTQYLYELREKWKVRKVLHKTVFKQLLLLAALSPIWLVIGIFSSYYTDNFWLPKVAFLFPISVLIFVLSLFRVYKKFGGIQKQEYIGRLIKTEIENREKSGLESIPLW
jgi:hypothetical protein